MQIFLHVGVEAYATFSPKDRVELFDNAQPRADFLWQMCHRTEGELKKYERIRIVTMNSKMNSKKNAIFQL